MRNSITKISETIIYTFFEITIPCWFLVGSINSVVTINMSININSVINKGLFDFICLGSILQFLLQY